MEELFTISTTKPDDIAFDYEELRKQGIEHIKKNAAAIWTDHNIHDPGITTLEILCYAITDLSYRSRYAIPDLMRKEGDNPASVIKEFFTAKQIFPNNALTINDYRKLLINVEKVKNVWLVPKPKNIAADITHKKLVPAPPAGSTAVAVAIKGYYSVLLEFDIDVKTVEEQDKIIEEVKTLLQQNRNLCEDFGTIKKVDQQLFRLCCDIEMKPDADATAVMANIFFNIQLHLTPMVRFYSLQQMLNDKEENYTTDKIFEGPFISKGFIKEKELNASVLKTEIHLSDLMQIMLNQPEVTTVPDILFNDITQTTGLANKWVIPVTDGRQPVADIMQSNIVVYKNGLPVRLNKQNIKTAYDKLMADYLAKNENMQSEDLKFETGTYRGAEKYHSIHHHFPKAYGISHWGLPPEATIARQKQAKQLQAYLLLFDQVMANYLSQLSSVKNLFSTANEEQTYFTQVVKDFKDPTHLYNTYTEIKNGNVVDEDKSWKNTVAAIQLAAEEKESKQFYKRRNIFLDHLLSRFAESFFEYINIYISHFPADASDKKILELKKSFLANYPEYSSKRALAYNYTQADKLWDTDENISGFEKRIQRLLGFENLSRRSLVNFISEITEELQADNTKLYSFKIVDKKGAKVLLTADEKFNEKERAEEELKIAKALCTTAGAMTIVEDPADNKFRIEVKDKLNTLIAVGEKGTKAGAEKDRKKLVQIVTDMADEGFFLIEHLLLFDRELVTFLPICVDTNCEECSETDPYSFRVSIIMPAYAKRFLDMEFRSYIEKTMREEMPAHLLVKICWVSNEQLSELEDAYKDWLPVKAKTKEDTDGKILQRLLDILPKLKSIYPETCMKTCTEDEVKQLFILNKNSLGTQKS